MTFQPAAKSFACGWQQQGWCVFNDDQPCHHMADEDIADMNWQPMDTAPQNGEWIQAEIPGHGSDNVIAWLDAYYDSNDNSCGGWTFMTEQEPPDCWNDGVCWEVNEDGVPSVKPTRWKPLSEHPTTSASQ